MDITFNTPKLQKEFSDARALLRNRGKIQANKIMVRMSQLRAATNLGILRPPTPGHFHLLTADKQGSFACDLDGNYRLILEPDHDPLPVLEDGGLNWKSVTQVKIIGVLDYHEQKNKKPV